MDKVKVIQEIKQLSQQNAITMDEISGAFKDGKVTKSNFLTREVGIAEVFYFLGGLIVFIGIAVLISQNWDSLSPLIRIISTLGFGVASYFTGVLLKEEERFGAISYAFHLIAALVIPIGIWVVMDQAGFKIITSGVYSFIFGILFFMYLSSALVFKKVIFTFFTFVFGTIFYFSFTNYTLGQNPFFSDLKFFEYRFLLAGLSYLFFGYYFSKTDQKEITETLYLVGNLFFLGAALVLGGWKPNQNVIWELIYPILVFIGLTLSVKIKSSAFLLTGTIFLMIYILKITAEYFSGTLGWPLALVLSGITLIGIGYYAFTLNKKLTTQAI